MKMYTLNYSDGGTMQHFLEREEQELILDVEDLSGILEQIISIKYGWTDPFDYFEIEEQDKRSSSTPISKKPKGTRSSSSFLS